MGLFDKLGGNKEISLTPQAGMLLSAITMAAIDGDADDDELAVIRRLDGSGRTDAWDSAVKAWKMKSLEECIALAAGSMNSEQRIVAIANLIDIAMADGTLAGAEQRLLEAYVEAFEVGEEIIEQIVDVISIKNNKSIF
jgi:tellurite resistance protein